MENSLKRLIPLFLVPPLLLVAHVEDPHVITGEAAFENPDRHTQWIHAADKTAINCKTFNVGKDETVRFIQPHQKARVLCRVTGKEASLIEGRLEANGRLFLINPNSIYFRETAQVNVHSLIASTLNIKDEDFVKGNYRFFLDKDAKNSAVVNRGKIEAEQDVVFMAPQIIHRAVVKAKAGRVVFLGGELITLNFEGDNLISFAIDGPLKTGFIEQAGQIESGQEVFLKLRAADETIRSVVNTSGIEEARGMQFENGKVYLVAGSSIAAPKIHVESPLVQTAGDFPGAKKIEITADKELKWQGGQNNVKFGSTEIALNASSGMLTIDAPLGKNKDDKTTVKNLTLKGKTIDQNASIKTSGYITYSGDTIFLSGDTHALNSHITYNGPVVVDGNDVKIASGQTKGDIVFNGTLDADHPGRSLTIYNGKESGTVSFKETIGSKGSLDLSIETGKLSLFNVGDKNHAGVGKLQVKSENHKIEKNVELFGDVIHTNEQIWDVPHIDLSSGQPTTFIVHKNPLLFSTASHLFLTPQTNVVFETHGGSFELSSLTGDHQQTIIINTGHGDAQIGGFGGKLGLLRVEGQNIYYTGDLDAGSIFIEAQELISYAKETHGITYHDRKLHSEGEVTLNAKYGTVGAREFPIQVESEGKFYVGAKSYAYVKGSCEGDFPKIYPKNPPPRTVFNGIEIRYEADADNSKDEQESLSLAPHLFHIIPHGFLDGKNFVFRRAPIYYVK